MLAAFSGFRSVILFAYLVFALGSQVRRGAARCWVNSGSDVPLAACSLPLYNGGMPLR